MLHQRTSHSALSVAVRTSQHGSPTSPPLSSEESLERRCWRTSLLRGWSFTIRALAARSTRNEKSCSPRSPMIPTWTKATKRGHSIAPSPPRLQESLCRSRSRAPGAGNNGTENPCGIIRPRLLPAWVPRRSLSRFIQCRGKRLQEGPSRLLQRRRRKNHEPIDVRPVVEDQTTLKWRGFTLRNGGSRYIAINPYAYRATSVKELADAADPVGPDNPRYLREVIAEADVLVPCWGNANKVPPRLRHHFADLLDM